MLNNQLKSRDNFENKTQRQTQSQSQSQSPSPRPGTDWIRSTTMVKAWERWQFMLLLLLLLLLLV